MTVDLYLPYPPSVNRYYRHVGSKVLISREGREYREKVAGIAAEERLVKFTNRISVTIGVFPPDNRRRDLDNILKALLDALVHGGVIEDDSLIDTLVVFRHHVEKHGTVCVIISESKDGREQEQS